MTTDYTKRSINDLCRLYGRAEVALETSVFRETRQALYAEIRAIISEAQRRDEKLAQLVDENLARLIGKALDAEIEWSERNGPNTVPVEWREGFIKGLHHAKLIVGKVNAAVKE